MELEEAVTANPSPQLRITGEARGEVIRGRIDWLLRGERRQLLSGGHVGECLVRDDEPVDGEIFFCFD